MVLARWQRWAIVGLGLAWMAPSAFADLGSADLLASYIEGLNDAGTQWILVIAGIGQGWAFWVFRTLAILQFTFLFLHWMLRGKRNALEFLTDFAIRYFYLGLLWAVVNWWGGLGGIPQEFFGLTGQLLSGLEGIDGWEMADAGAGAILGVFLDPKLVVPFITGGAGWILITLIVVVISYLAIVMRQIQILTKSMALYATGPLFLSFGAAGLTAGLADGYIRAAVKVGLELMGLYMAVSLGAEISQRWLMAWQELSVLDVYSQLIHLIKFAFGMGVWAAVVVTLPASMASIAEGYTLGIADMMRIRR